MSTERHIVTKRRVVAFLLAFLMVFTQLPLGQVVHATEIAPTTGETIVNDGKRVVMLNMPDDKEEILAIEAEKPVDRAVLPGVNTGIDWASYQADMVIAITAATDNAQQPPFYWEEILGAGPVEFELLVTDKNGTTLPAYGQKVSVTKNDLTDTAGQLAGTVKFPEKSRFYDDNGDRLHFGIVLPANILTAVQIHSITSSGKFDSEIDPKVYTLEVTMARIANSETTVEWHTTNAADNKENPQLVGIFSDGNNTYNFDLPKTNGSKILRNDFKDIPGVSDPKISVDQLAGVTTDSAGHVDHFNVTVDKVADGKITAADNKTYYVTTTYDQITGGRVVVKEEMTVSFVSGAGTFTDGVNTVTSPVNLKVPYGDNLPTDQIPTPVPPTGQFFQGWVTGVGTPEEKLYNPGEPVTANAVVTAKYGNNVIPVENPDDEVPAGYHRVVFNKNVNGEFKPNKNYKIAGDGNIYFNVKNGTAFSEVKLVMPEVTDITLNTGWKLKTPLWNTKADGTGTELPADTHTGDPAYAEEAYFVQYEAFADIIPGDEEKPAGYITVIFDAGEGTFEGNTKPTSYHVNPLKNKTIGDLTKPDVKAPFGKDLQSWDPGDTTPIQGTDDITVTAKYGDKAPVVDNDPNDEDYVSVEFQEGAKGQFTDTPGISKKVWALKNVNASVVFDHVGLQYDFPININVEEGFAFDGFKDSINGEKVGAATLIPEIDVIYTAQYDEKIVPIDDPDNPGPNPDEKKYAKVTFNSGTNGTFGGTTAPEIKAYWVLKDGTVPVADVFAKATLDTGSDLGITPDLGFAFKEWTPQDKLTGTITDAVEYLATYNSKEPVVDDNPNDPDYVPVTFSAGAPGKFANENQKTTVWALRGTMSEEVFKYVGLAIATPAGLTIPETHTFDGYTDGGGTLVDTTTAIPDGPVDYTAQYKENVKPVEDPNVEPEPGYHRVTFTTDEEKGTFAENAITAYDVLSGKTLPADKAPAIDVKPGSDHTGWNPELPLVVNKNETVEATYRETTIPVADPKTPTPEGYVRVTLKPGDHGRFTPKEGTTVQPNNDPTQQVILLDVKENTAILGKYVPDVVASPEWTSTGWDPEITEPVTKTQDTFTATYDQNVIETDPDNPEVKPGYHLVTFDAGTNGSFGNNTAGDPITKKAYNVKDGVQFGEVRAELPEIVPNAGYVQKPAPAAWTPELPTDATPVTVAQGYTAQYDKQIIPVDDNNPDNPDPDKYAKVTFKSGENGTFGGDPAVTDKAYWVLKNNTVKVSAVFTEAGFDVASGKGVSPNHGFSFKEWTPQLTLLLNVTDDAEYTANYTPKEPIVDADPNDPDYVSVSFLPGDNAKFVDKQVKTQVWALKGIPASDVFTHAGVAYNSDKNLEIDPGYTFSHYKKNADASRVDALSVIPDTNVVYQGVHLEDIIDNPTDPTPPGYHRVTFSAENGGDFAPGAVTVFDVLDGVTFPEAKAPGIVAKEDQVFTGWDPKLSFAVKADTTVKAQYQETTIPVIDPGTPTPPGYVRVTLKPGANGTLTPAPDTTLINGEVLLDVKEGTAILTKFVPTIVPEDTHVENGWSPAITTPVTDNDKEFTAQYKQKIVPVVDPNVDPEEGYARITFTTDTAKGSFKAGETTAYDVLIGETLPKDKAPTIIPEPGQNHIDWDPEGPWKVTEATTVAATFGDKPEIVEVDPTDGDYVKVTFLAGDGGAFASPDKKTLWALKGTDASKVFTHAGLAIGDATGIDVLPTKLFANYSEDGTATVAKDAKIPTKDVIYTATYTDKIPSLKPSDLTQKFDKVGDKQYIDGKLDGFVPGTDTTGWEIILTDVNGNPILEDGQPIKGTIKDDGTFEFPINKEVLTHGQQVNAQLTEPNKLPTRADKLVTLDLEGPSITDITATPSAGLLEITAKTDDSSADFVVVIGDKTYPATVSNGVITAKVPATGTDPIVIRGVDQLGNGNRNDGTVTRPTTEPKQFAFQVQAAYAGNRRLTVYGGPETALAVRILRDGEVFATRNATTSKGSGRATIAIPALELGDVVEIIGTSNEGVKSDTFIMEITQ